MSFDIPAYIEPEIRDYALAQHITEDQAVVRLIKAGLEHVHSTEAATSIIGAFSSAEDQDAMDVALDLAMRDRERRNGPRQDG